VIVTVNMQVASGALPFAAVQVTVVTPFGNACGEVIVVLA